MTIRSAYLKARIILGKNNSGGPSLAGPKEYSTDIPFSDHIQEEFCKFGTSCAKIKSVINAKNPIIRMNFQNFLILHLLSLLFNCQG